MAEIRPPSWPLVPQAPTAPKTDPRAAAQRAFFQAALTGQAVAAPTAQPEAPVRAQRKPDLTIQMPEEPPQEFLRPGSIIDIRV